MLFISKSLLLLAFIFLSPLSVQAQQRMISWPEIPTDMSKLISIDPNSKGVAVIDSLELMEVRVKGVTVNFGQPFIGDADWMKYVTFKIKNISNASIVYVQISAFLPQIMPGGPLVPFIFVNRDAKSLDPGEEAELPVAVFQWAQKAIEKKTTLPQITQIEVHDILVKFEDGSQVHGRCMKALDSKNACPKFRE